MSTAKRALLAVGAGVLIAAIAAGAGFYWGSTRSEPELIEARARIDEIEQDRAQLRAELDVKTEELAAADGRQSLLEARRQLAIAIDQLDSRNFGLVQRHCEASAAVLRSGDPDHAVSSLAERLERYRFGSGANFDAARGELRALASQLDALVMPIGAQPESAGIEPPGLDAVEPG